MAYPGTTSFNATLEHLHELVGTQNAVSKNIIHIQRLLERAADHGRVILFSLEIIEQIKVLLPNEVKDLERELKYFEDYFCAEGIFTQQRIKWIHQVVGPWLQLQRHATSFPLQLLIGSPAELSQEMNESYNLVMSLYRLIMCISEENKKAQTPEYLARM